MGHRLGKYLRIAFIITCSSRLAVAAGVRTLRGAETLLDLPISDCGNRAYLTSAAERPWWNAAWKRRAPILVSGFSGEASVKTIVDCVVDFGEAIDPAAVRLVTPWETTVPCVAEKAEGTALRLLFKTSLRPNENRPFLVYWDNPAATRERVRAGVTLEADDREVHVANGVLDVTFDNEHKTAGFLKTLRVIASETPNELLERATGFAWGGFSLLPGGQTTWSKATVTADNAFLKEIRFSSDRGDVFFRLYAEQPRVDWRYSFRPDVRSVKSAISFGVGGGTAYDDILYCGSAGKVLALKAGLDENTDCIPHPEYNDLAAWISEGWIAIRDRKAKDYAGVFFDRDALAGLRYWGHAQCSGEEFSFTFAHGTGGTLPTTGSGALVANIGDAEEIRREYRRVRFPPKVFVGAAESVRTIPVRIPHLAHDFCADFNIGQGSGAGWRSGEPLDGTDWASNTVDHIRSMGANTLHVCGLKVNFFRQVPVEPSQAKRWQSRLPEGTEPYGGLETVKNDRHVLRDEIAAAHAKGVATDIWGSYLPGWRLKSGSDAKLNAEACAVDREMQNLIVDAGVDCYANALPQGEGPIYHAELGKKYGRAFWQWPDPSLFFADQDFVNEQTRTFYRQAKAHAPDKPVILWNSENGELRREQFMTEQAGSFDSCMVEILPHENGFPRVKHIVKRMRSLFNNEPGRTVYHHFYFYPFHHYQRIWETAMPFICGVNGFSYENLTYENLNPEYCEMIADFYRFAEYTKLGDKAAKMGPVKNLAVFRDTAAFRADIACRRTGSPYPYHAQHDGRVRSFGEIPNYSYDVVISRFFTAKDLRPYRAVYVPEDPVFTDAFAQELLAYVEAGGGAIVEGVTATNRVLAALGLRDGEVRALGKGRISRFAAVMTDALAKRDAKTMAAVTNRVAAVGGAQPYSLTGRGLDSILQASDEGLLLGVINVDRTRPAKGTFSLDATSSALLVRPRFVLDVKRGVQTPFTGSFEVSLAPGCTAYYLLGDAAFTSVPAAKDAEMRGASASAARGKAHKLTPSADASCAPQRGVEIAPARNGLRPTSRAAFAKVMTTVVNTKGATRNFDREKMGAAIAAAQYVLVLAEADESDVVFKECASELKELLKRGGGICFNHVTPGPAARALLKDVGVFDPTASAETGVGDGRGVRAEGVADDNPMLAQARREMPMFSHGVGYRRVYRTWDRERQSAPYRAALDPNAAVVVLQDKVLGAGKVIFSENTSAFTDWYENITWGENILSWFLGRHVEEHAERVKRYNGGPGDPVLHAVE